MWVLGSTHNNKQVNIIFEDENYINVGDEIEMLVTDLISKLSPTKIS